MRDFREIKVWQKAHIFVIAIYKATADFPKEEMYGLTSQIRRAAVSITSNIAEGACRFGNKELRQFMSISMGSASEVDYQLLLAKDLKYISDEVYRDLAGQIIEVKKMLAGFIKTLKAEN